MPAKKAAAKKPKRPAKKAAAGSWRVRIRMYRKWLGDCFLLSFRNKSTLSHVLIDCGTFWGSPQGKQKIVQAVQSIAAETGGKLDALVVTHEHWDHVSGFSQALDEFKNLDIGEVWAAWTEDPDQDVAKDKKKQKKLQLAAVSAALRHWSASDNPQDQERGAAVAALMGFQPEGGIGPALAAFSESSNEAMTNALSLGPNQLLEPGTVLEPAFLPGVRVHVLAPPRAAASLRDMTGTPETDMYGGRDTLGASASTGADTAFYLAAAGQIPDSGIADRYAPFDRYLQWDEAAWKARWPLLADSYRSEPHRAIDRDWLNSAAELALQLDSYTNNTSLVLAFELTGTREVLLFVGDAQIGNWLSWAKGAKDLLAKTIFYKVGHHGSHNATLKTGGLEAMKSPQLVAAIPVDEDFARKPKGGSPEGWDMPAGPLLTALTEKTKGRVLRGDSDFPEGAARPAALSAAEWNSFCGAVKVDEHFIDYFVA
jgi:hypothetical protein